MLFAPSEFKMPLNDWICSKPDFELVKNEVDRFSYLGDRISPGGRLLEEVSAHIKCLYWHSPKFGVCDVDVTSSVLQF